MLSFHALKRPPPPLTAQDEVVNRLKLVANYIRLGDRDALLSAAYVLDELLEWMASKRTKVEFSPSA